MSVKCFKRLNSFFFHIYRLDMMMMNLVYKAGSCSIVSLPSLTHMYRNVELMRETVTMMYRVHELFHLIFI